MSNICIAACEKSADGSIVLVKNRNSIQYTPEISDTLHLTHHHQNHQHIANKILNDTYTHPFFRFFLRTKMKYYP